MARRCHRVARDRRPLAPIAALVVGLLVIAGLAAASDPVPGRHTDHGRFTAAAEGFPPQPVDVSDARPITPGPTFAGAPPGTAARAAQDDAVAPLLDDAPQLIGVEDLAPKPGEGAGGHRVTWYSPADRHSVRATVRDGVVAQVEVIPAADWQPPLTPAEEDLAHRIARDGLRSAGHAEVDALEGYVIPAMDEDGSYPATRLAYVTFHAHVDARPRLLAWVDLTSGRLLRSRVEPGAPSPAGPSHTGSALAGTAPPRQGSVDWRGWTFDYDVSGRMDGVSLADVEWHGLPIMARASLPAMTVFYDGDVCGPFVDRLGGELTPVDWADGAQVVLRELQQHGRDWLEVGILDTIGDYVLYQVFYLSEDGQIDAHTFAKGVQCAVDHLHHPFWRLDIDVAGPDGDQVLRRTATGEVVEGTEFDASAADAVDHGWVVRDVATGHRVLVDFDDGSWNVPGQVLPEEAYEANRVYGRRYSAADAGPWMQPAVTELGGNGGRALDGQDLVLWYRGHLPHTATEGPDLWHSTGVRLTLDLQRGHYVRPPDGVWPTEGSQGR